MIIETKYNEYSKNIIKKTWKQQKCVKERVCKWGRLFDRSWLRRPCLNSTQLIIPELNPQKRCMHTHLHQVCATSSNSQFTVHKSIVTDYPGPNHGGSRLRRATHLFPPPHLPATAGGTQGVSRPAGICNPSSMFWVCPSLSYILGTHPGGILIRYLNYLTWSLSMRSCSSAPSSSGCVKSSHHSYR